MLTFASNLAREGSKVKRRADLARNEVAQVTE